jgi:hypothetical protein
MDTTEDFVTLANKPLQRNKDEARRLITELDRVKTEIQPSGRPSKRSIATASPSGRPFAPRKPTPRNRRLMN